jgi:hypothetical protein
MLDSVGLWNEVGVTAATVCLIATAVDLDGAARGAAPSEAEVQGLYEGTGSDANGAFKIEARIVGQGGGNFHVFIRQVRGQGKLVRAELKGKIEGDTMTLAGNIGEVPWKGDYAAGAIKGTCLPGGVFQVQRIDRKSPKTARSKFPGEG